MATRGKKVYTGKNIVKTEATEALSIGGQKFIPTRDVNELFSDILLCLRVLVAQNNEIYDIDITEEDLEEL